MTGALVRKAGHWLKGCLGHGWKTTMAYIAPAQKLEKMGT